MIPRFLQIHTLTGYPVALLNRDDVGLGKTCSVDGALRSRISSQCLKRHWRVAEDEWALQNLGPGISTRSRAIFQKEIFEPLCGEGLDPELVGPILAEVRQFILKMKDEDEAPAEEPADKKGKKPKKEEKSLDLGTKQPIVLGRPEIEFLTEITREIVQKVKTPEEGLKLFEAYKADKERKKNLEAMAQAGAVAGIDGALFGRMTTSDILSRIDAAVSVSHAWTVHTHDAENDYFSVCDDLSTASQADYIGEQQLVSGLYYLYVTVNLPLLISNLEGCPLAFADKADRKLAAQTVEHLIHLIATVSPGAKKGSTAPYAYARMVMVESGSRQPRSLGGAFFTPITLGANLTDRAIAALGTEARGLDNLYGKHEERRFIAMGKPEEFPATNAETLDELAKWAGKALKA